MRLRKIVLFSTGFMLLLVATVAIIYAELLNYGWQQLHGQWTIIQGAKPLSHFLQDSSQNKKWGKKIRLVQAIKRYGADSLGLDTADTYASLYLPPPSEPMPTMWVVTACAPYALRPYKWHFPVIGSFPYKGFFSHNAALREDSTLRAKGYDTDLSTASGWSTLGWIENPLLPNMLSRSPGRLADLLLHELTHNTIYLRDNVNFNENLASFVGTEGAKAFLHKQYGDSSSYYKEYVAYIADYKRYYKHVLRAAGELDRFYRSLSSQLAAPTKARLKEQKITALWASIDSICFDSKAWQRFQRRERPFPNNTYFVDYLRYRGKNDSLERIFRHQTGSLRSFIMRLKQQHLKQQL